jgi:hypothetical protein
MHRLILLDGSFGGSRYGPLCGFSGSASARDLIGVPSFFFGTSGTPAFRETEISTRPK